MLVSEQRMRLKELVRNAYLNEADMEMFLIDKMGAQYNSIAPTGLTFPQALSKIIIHYENDDIIPFLKALADDRRNDDVAHFALELMTQLGTPENSGNGAPDPYEICLVPNFPYVNHASLKDAIQRLEDRSNQVLLVSGPPNSGKTYSTTFLRYLRNRQQSFSLKPVRLDEFDQVSGASSSGEYDASQSITDLFRILADAVAGDGEGAGNDIDQLAQISRQSSQMVDWLEDRLRGPGHPFWLLFDGIHDAMDHRISEFITELTQRTTKGNIPRLHLILMGDPDWLPQGITLWSEQVKLNELTVDDLAEFIVRYGVQKGLSHTYEPEIVENMLQQLLDDAGPGIQGSGDDDPFPAELRKFLTTLYEQPGDAHP